MKSTSLAEIRKELKLLSREEVMVLCEKLAKYRKENKEFLSYLMFYSLDEDAYTECIKQDVAEAFSSTNTSGFYLAKKSVRRALRIANKHIKFSKKPETEVDVLIFFCEEMNALDLNWKSSRVLVNLYNRQLTKINRLYSELHEDLKFEFEARLANL